MIAWKLVTKFDEQRHLFFEKIDTNYIVETYLCTCGHTEFIVKHPEQETNYVCEECENTKFYDANSAWRNIEHFLYQTRGLKLSYGYDIQKGDESIIANYVVEIPTQIDFLSSKVLFSKKPVYSLILTSDGDLKENYSLRFNKIISLEMRKYLTKYINENGCLSVPDFGDKFLSLTVASFFLKHKHLKDFDLYDWVSVDNLHGDEIYIDTAFEQILNNRKEKSIKKALFVNYLNQIDNSGKFYSAFAEACIKAIKDVNLIVDFLKIDFEYLDLGDFAEEQFIYQIICFLKNYYSEKLILKLFSGYVFSINVTLFRDLMRGYHYDRDSIEANFRKVPCKILALHDEFVRCSRDERYEDIQNKILSYSMMEYKACCEVDTYSVKLPNCGAELFDWANDLHNCMASYFYMIESNESIIYGFFKKNILMFAVEINDGVVVQTSSNYNAKLSTKESETVQRWFALYFQENKQRIEHVA